MPFVGGIAAIVGLGMSAYQYGHAQKQKKREDAAARHEIYNSPTYNTPGSVNEQVNAARTQMGAPDPAVSAAYGQAQQQAADERAYAQRNASSGAQALAVGSQTQQQVNSILPALAQQQQGYNQMGLSNLNQALGAKTEDDRAKYEAQRGQYSDLVNYHLGLVGAAQNDKSQAIALGAQALTSGLGAYSQYRAGIHPNLPRVNTTTPVSPIAPVQGGMATTVPTAYPTMQPVGTGPAYGGYNPLTAYYLQQRGIYPFGTNNYIQ